MAGLRFSVPNSRTLHGRREHARLGCSFSWCYRRLIGRPLFVSTRPAERPTVLPPSNVEHYVDLNNLYHRHQVTAKRNIRL
jgi:hypothetical protein